MSDAPDDAALPKRENKWYGWVPDLPDHRDLTYEVQRGVRLSAEVDLRSKLPPVLDQGPLGSCTANAISSAIEFDRMRQGLTPRMVPSRLFIYYNERVMEGSVNEDAGAMIRDGIKSVAKLGVCTEQTWAYEVNRFTMRPPREAYVEALRTRAVSYRRLLTSVTAMRNCLALGYPFVFGFSVYESFESDEVARTGEAPMPGERDQFLGGHAVLCCGYHHKSKRFLVRNSWGEDWGDAGYFTLPYDYLSNPNLADDRWQVTLVSG